MSDLVTLDRQASSQHGLLTRKQLLALGLSADQIDARLRSGLFVRRHREVYALVGAAPSWEHRACAAVFAGGDLCAVSHRSAARLWGFRTVDDEIEIAIRHPRKRTVRGAIVHRSRDLARSDITWVNNIATTTPERTICDLGLVFPQHEVQRILHHAVATGLVNRRELELMRYRNGRQGRNGVGVLGRVLATLTAQAELAESGAEVFFLEFCAQHGLPEPLVQMPMIVGGRTYRPDFLFPDARVFVEIDGFEFHSGAAQIAADDGRQNALVSAGWSPLRFTRSQLRADSNSCARMIRRALGFVPPEP